MHAPARVRAPLLMRSLPPGIFSVIAAVIIFVMGITMLKIDRAKTKWRIKLQRSFSGRSAYITRSSIAPS